MAGRKKKKDTSGGAGSFQANPFKQLKGFAVSAPAAKRPDDKKSQAASCAETAPRRQDDAALFAAEMARLGVAPGEGCETNAPSREDPAAKPPSESAPPPASDRDLFLAALKGMDAVFEDEFPVAEEKGVAAPRRMKLLRQGRLTPEAKLDLHGRTRDEARTKVGYFLEDAAYQGKKTVLIVTGRGKGSAEGPVLRGEIERYLAQEGAGRVSEWGRAPARYGGEGALVVFLKERKEN